MIWQALWLETPFLLQGVLVLLELLFAILSVGFVVGLTLALFQIYGNRFSALIAASIKRFFLSVPAVILLFIFYYGTSGFIDLSPFAAAVLALGMRSASYQSQIFTGAIQAIGAGQMHAGLSIGLSRVGTIRYVIFPQAFRLLVGPWSNEYSSAAKGTALAYLIGVVELLRRGKYIISYTYGNALTVYMVLAVVYFIITWTGNRILYRLEQRIAVPGLETRESARRIV